jgi:hypothetical chaperone protein
MPGLRIGLDFGTSNSGVAVYDGHSVCLLPLDRSNITPEVVKTVLYLTRDLKPFVGQEAIDLYYKQNVNRPRRFVKKWAGEIDVYGGDMFYVDDLYTLVDELLPGRLLQYLKTGLRSEGYRGTMVFERYYPLDELISVYIGELKQRAEKELNQPVTGVTLGRPVKFFDDPQKDYHSQETLRQAALRAGFQSVEFEYEPVAAACYYELSLGRPENTLIFDFGGGTLDITIMRLGDPAGRHVYANGGIGIAGSDFDKAIMRRQMLAHFGKGAVDEDPDLNMLIDAISDWNVLPQLSTPEMKARLTRAVNRSRVPTRLKALEALIFNDMAFQFYNQVEAGKIALSDSYATVIRMTGEDIYIWELLTRLQFENDIIDERGAIRQCLLDTLADSGLEAAQIDSVIRTGGSSSVPCFISMLEEIFGPHKVKASDTFNSVTAGLAVRAYQMS